MCRLSSAFIAGVFCILIASLLGAQTARAFQVLEWGPIARDFRLSISSTSYKYKAGVPVLVTILLENLGPDLTAKPSSCVEWEWYAFEIRDARGTIVPRHNGGVRTCGWNPASWTISSHEVLLSTFDLRDKYDLTTPGDYEISATSNIDLPAVSASPRPTASAGTVPWIIPLYTTVESNTIHIEIEPN
jgi:hypothetical protein